MKNALTRADCIDAAAVLRAETCPALAVSLCSAPLTWGVDGYGTKHYLCARCEEVFGPVDPDAINHQCTKA